jgi:hypothetical protein
MFNVTISEELLQHSIRERNSQSVSTVLELNERASKKQKKTKKQEQTKK